MTHALISTTGLAALMLTLTACTSDKAGFPTLLPTAQVLAPPTLPDHAGPVTSSSAQVDAQTTARADALRARADALRGPVIEPGSPALRPAAQ